MNGTRQRGEPSCSRDGAQDSWLSVKCLEVNAQLIQKVLKHKVFDLASYLVSGKGQLVSVDLGMDTISGPN